MIIRFSLNFLKIINFGMPQDGTVSALLSKKEPNLEFVRGTTKVKISILRTLRFQE